MQFRSNTSECAFGSDNEGQDVCSRPEIVAKLKKFAKINKEATSKEIIEKAKELTNCNSESCLYHQPEIQNIMDFNLKELLKKDFKPYGPFNTNDSLDNFTIMNVLKQLQSVESNQFYAIEYQVSDFMENKNSELTSLDWIGLMKRGYRCFGVILNTVTYQQVMEAKKGGKTPGKHWFALFFDFRTAIPNEETLKQLLKNTTKTSRKTRPCTIEFFNSSGNLPHSPLKKYMKSLELDLASKLPGLSIFSVVATFEEQQKSQYECGVYSLFYIYSRMINEISCMHFLNHRLTDEDCLNIVRKLLFRHDYQKK